MNMNTIDRRTMLRLMSAAPAAAAFAITDAEARHAHALVEQAKEVAQKAGAKFTPKFFTAHEYATVRLLVDMIIPKDERSGSATDAGVPEFMDFTMVDQPARQVAMRGGLAWLDRESERRYDQRFATATPAQRDELLADVATYGQLKPGLTHGQAFFRAFRDLTATGFWTSKMGMTDIGYMGNTVVAKWEGCPSEQIQKLGLA
jgi:gluconate 2-dehydrogenase gamma chain